MVGMDQRSFAALLGHKPGAYAQWEADNAKPRDIVELARKIEEVTHVPAAWLLGIESPPVRPTSGEEGWAPSGSNRRPKDYRGDVSTFGGLSLVREPKPAEPLRILPAPVDDTVIRVDFRARAARQVVTA